MGVVEFSNADFAVAGEQLRVASEAFDDASHPEFGAVGSSVVESALLRVDDILRGVTTSLSDAGAELVARTAAVQSELQRTDAELAGGP
jgi:hypothetical protein